MGFYIFSLHIPLSFGGLSIVSQLLHQTVLDPKTQVIQYLNFTSTIIFLFLDVMWNWVVILLFRHICNLFIFIITNWCYSYIIFLALVWTFSIIDVWQAFSLLLIQALELVAFLSLLHFSEKQFNIISFFETRVLPNDRNWLLASVLGLGFLLALVFFTSIVADKLIGTKVSLQTIILYWGSTINPFLWKQFDSHCILLVTD